MGPTVASLGPLGPSLRPTWDSLGPPWSPIWPSRATWACAARLWLRNILAIELGLLGLLLGELLGFISRSIRF